MDRIENAKLLRIFVGESDKIGNINVYEKIVTTARKDNLAGATVYRGIMGFGKNSIIHTSKIFALSDDMPLVIEIVDSASKIDEFIPKVKDIFEKADNGGLVTIEKAEIIQYTSSKEK
ncbi:MAG: DUF190 domain-containing protein [Bacteroidetes bacterium]|nr:DUF190 domain-containing protein [Bacteroidota bacterium]MBU1114153.1 DUF190 domain-containing protein [Bacteroidota bacterium]MBU1796830.1 DUF190 domain-containing protein [Bacteroidota bacterium]